MSVLLETSVGDLVIDLYTDEAPLTCKNFLKLCKIKYYNFSFIHKVEKGFIAQMGDPTGTGQGGESVYGVLGGSTYFPAEINPKLKHKRGTIAMAVLDPETRVSGSQFYIAFSDTDYLDGRHAVFGEVAEGWDALDKIDISICDASGRPLSDILIRHTIILHDPFPDPPNLPITGSPLHPSASQKALMRIEAGDTIEATDDARRRELEAKAQALTLEMIGDLPFADIRPPENILFVCKLNPVTQDDDLETIFARFGTIVSCEVVRDKEGASLGYAFIEFETKEACEEAYFKMDNVLIDDRRVHVDFSQSVSRLNGRWVRTKPQARLVPKSRYRGERELGSEYEMVFGSPEEMRGAGRHRADRKRRDREHSDRSRDQGDRSRHRSRSPDANRKNKNSSRDSRDRSNRRSRFDR
ncbi:Peptidyl-prolyl cis-trans isomerase-like 4 [Coemansia spiralis]|uniref:Peptidyl-prolyl cis-trans isomerase n=2 Tax=Coemansia TaxID=4863 RepID=A0A9W8FZV6_9FUNG|nr:Peptidyl-prolyl cis-trans isomerase-like 4 [Coemansia umbellata]KAJ2620520.1 Peptidyl-prolyl cis-trans isomerase-like 4 [Coemansia sp. RSA 1358]KAJ2673404.1 Peptidyl-prolyl cis-trans isomerase-like 4 [Coemansia spiralis]